MIEAVSVFSDRPKPTALDILRDKVNDRLNELGIEDQLELLSIDIYQVIEDKLMSLDIEKLCELL
jgi:hypothetical protein